MSNVVSILFFSLLLAGCAAAIPMSGNAERGAQLFAQGLADAPACSTCHHTAEDQMGFSIGPNLAGIAERARTRVVGMTAAEYLRQSILEPRHYLVPGYRDMMYPDYRTHLTEAHIEDLIAYLLTL